MSQHNHRPRLASMSLVGRSTRRLVRALFETNLGVLLPILLVLLFFAAALALFNFVPAISPFVYPLM